MNHRTRVAISVIATIIPIAHIFGMGAGDQTPLFVEQAGVAEFSGRMIARPRQTTDARAAAQGLLINDDLIAYRSMTDEYIFRVPDGSTENIVASRLMSLGIFEYVEPDWRAFAVECPDDPFFDVSWHHEMMESCKAWDVHNAMMSPVSIAVVDTGIRATHEDLRRFRLEGYDAFHKVWESSGGDIVDIFGHGTLTTGAAAAEGDNTVGGSGMGWQLQHRMVKAVEGGNGWAYISDLTHGAMVGIQNGDFVASVSFSVGWHPSVETAGEVIMNDLGGLLVWAAGNEAERHDDGDHPHVIIVGATDRNGNKASFSNYGEFIDVFAPGVDVLTTTMHSDSSYGWAGGTSLATPLVSGLCAMLKSARPEFNNRDVLRYLEAGCRDMGDESLYGHGEISLNRSFSLFERLQLELVNPPLNARRNEKFVASFGEPFKKTALFYSTVGEGQTIIPGTGIVLGLKQAKRASRVRLTDARGEVSWTLHMPHVNNSLPLWLQAAQESERVSQVLETQLVP